MTGSANRNLPPSGQIPFELPVDPGFARSDLIVTTTNRLAVEFIDSWPDWQGKPVVLVGPVGSGKSHLAHIWAGQAKAQIIDAKSLDAGAGELQSDCNLVVENITNDTFQDRNLFHLLNSAGANGKSVLMLSRHWPQSWGVELADLNSRLRAATLLELSEPDDEMLKQVLLKLFADRQVAVDQSVVDFMTLRMERSIRSATEAVEYLDREALARQKKITRSLAAEALEVLSNRAEHE